MKSERKLLRRDFIIYFFSSFILAFIVNDQFKEKEINIDSEIINKIKTHNSLRTIKSQKDLRSAIKSDLKNNKTIFVGKRLYTYAEISYADF